MWFIGPITILIIINAWFWQFSVSATLEWYEYECSLIIVNFLCEAFSFLFLLLRVKTLQILNLCNFATLWVSNIAFLKPCNFTALQLYNFTILVFLGMQPYNLAILHPWRSASLVTWNFAGECILTTLQPCNFIFCNNLQLYNFETFHLPNSA